MCVLNRNQSINVISATYFCLKFHSCSCVSEPFSVSLFKVTASWHKGRHSEYEQNKLQTIKGSTSITARLGLAGGLIGLILKIHRDGRLHKNKQLRGGVCTCLCV